MRCRGGLRVRQIERRLTPKWMNGRLSPEEARLGRQTVAVQRHDKRSMATGACDLKRARGKPEQSKRCCCDHLAIHSSPPPRWVVTWNAWPGVVDSNYPTPRGSNPGALFKSDQPRERRHPDVPACLTHAEVGRRTGYETAELGPRFLTAEKILLELDANFNRCDATQHHTPMQSGSCLRVSRPRKLWELKTSSRDSSSAARMERQAYCRYAIECRR